MLFFGKNNKKTQKRGKKTQSKGKFMNEKELIPTDETIDILLNSKSAGRFKTFDAYKRAMDAMFKADENSLAIKSMLKNKKYNNSFLKNPHKRILKALQATKNKI